MKNIEIASDFCIKELKSEILQFDFFKEDTKVLNEEILNSKFDISCMDFSLYPLVFEEYALCFSGAKFSDTINAKIVKKVGKNLKPNFKIALSDENSIHSMLIKINYPQCKIIVVDESKIEGLILNDEVHCGLIFDDKFSDELYVENDILSIWKKLIKQNLPLPISCFGIRRSIPLTDAIECQKALEKHFKDEPFFLNDTKKRALETLFGLGYEYNFYPKSINFYDTLIPVEYFDYRFS